MATAAEKRAAEAAEAEKAAAEAAAAETANGDGDSISFAAQLEADATQNYREPGPSSGQTFFLVQLLAHELEEHDPERYNEELRNLLRTRRGASALISHLAKKHGMERPVEERTARR
jgi:hypothetical protein